VEPGARPPYGQGVFRRRFLLRADPGRVVGDMEDDFHRFRVVLDHDGERVTRIRGEARRYPWTECPGATQALRALEGMALSARSTAAGQHTDPRQNCTHLFDLAALALTHAAAGRTRRLYDIAVPDRVQGATEPVLLRDGEELLRWQVRKEEILAPEPFAGVRMRGSRFLRWAEDTLDPETAEAAIALRRACYIAMGRARDLDEAPDASVYFPLARGSCHTFQPERASRAKRVRGTQLDLTEAPERLLADVLADPGPG